MYNVHMYLYHNHPSTQCTCTCIHSILLLLCCHFHPHLLSGNVEVRLERHGGLESLTILLNEVEVYSTHQTLVLIKNISLRERERERKEGGRVKL